MTIGGFNQSAKNTGHLVIVGVYAMSQEESETLEADLSYRQNVYFCAAVKGKQTMIKK
jgi:hypothetical protein